MTSVQTFMGPSTLYTDGCQVRLLDGLTRQRKLNTDGVQHERLDAVIKTVPGVTGIADDVLAKEDTKVSCDVSVLSLPEMAQSNNLSSMLTKYSSR